MQKSEITLLRLDAGEGMMLTNGESFGRSVYLGAMDSPDNWREITQAEYEAMLAAQEARGEEVSGNG